VEVVIMEVEAALKTHQHHSLLVQLILHQNFVTKDQSAITVVILLTALVEAHVIHRYFSTVRVLAQTPANNEDTSFLSPGLILMYE
jgi:hypothetical protein